MRKEPKTDLREHPHERDKEESKKETEGEAKKCRRNTRESVFTGSKGSWSLKKFC